MAYETPLLPTYDYADFATNSAPDLRRGDAIRTEYNGQLIRPYLGPMEANLYEADLGIDTYDPLTAPLAEVIEHEYGSQVAYDNAPTLWDRQSERAHLWAAERATVLGGLRRACEYRAQFPTDTETLQLRIVEPAPSSVDVALAELRQLKAEIAYEASRPPMFSTAQNLHAKYHHEQTLQLRIPDTLRDPVLPPSDADTGPAAHGDPSSAIIAEAKSTGSLPTASPATRAAEADQSPARDLPKATPPESGMISGSRVKVRRKLGPIGRKASEIWHIASLSKRGASRLIDRIKQQAGF